MNKLDSTTAAVVLPEINKKTADSIATTAVTVATPVSTAAASSLANASIVSKLDADTPDQVELKKRLHNKKVVVITLGVNGLGDYICARKICSYFHEKLGVPMNNIALSSDADEKTKAIMQGNGLNFIGDGFHDIQSWNADVQVFTPALVSKNLENIVRPRMVFNNTTPTLAIAEYGFKRPDHLEHQCEHLHAYSFGFSEDSLGYIPDAELRQWAKEKDSKTPVQRLQHLSNAPVVLQQAILGQPYSQTAIEKFAKGSKLYFGYAHQSSEVYSFISAVASMSHAIKDNSDLCFYMMGDETLPPSIMKAMGSAKFKKFEEGLIKAGIGKIEFVKISNSAKSKKSVNETLTINAASGRTLKFITGSIPFQHVNAMHMAAEDESLFTGDQFLSEGTSAEKLPLVYEQYPHKEKSYDQLLGALPAELIPLTAFYAPATSFDLAHELDSGKLAKFFILRRTNQKVGETVKKAMTHLAGTCDFSPRFDRALLKVLKLTEGLKRVVVEPFELPDEPELTGDEIPFDKQVWISGDDHAKLRINDSQDDLLSDHPQYADSKFRIRYMTEGYCLIRSKK